MCVVLKDADMKPSKTTQPRQELLDANVLNWLLEKKSPAVRYLTLKWLAGGSKDEIAEARQAIVGYPPIRDVLRKLTANPEVHPVDLSIMAMWGLSRKEPAVDAACQLILDHGTRQRGYGCYISHAVGGLIRMGYAGDPRLEPLIAKILRDQHVFDGNRPGTELRYGRLSGPVCAGSHSCFSAVVWALWALAAVPRRRSSPAIREFLSRGAEFLRIHRLYQQNHHGFKPVSSKWLRLQLPFGLGWRPDVLHALEVAGLVGMTNDPAAGDALRFLLSKRDAKGRWALERRHKNRTACCGSLWRAEAVGKPSKWITLSALIQMKRFKRLLPKLPEGSSEVPVEPAEARSFAGYPWRANRQDEQRVRQAWQDGQMDAALGELLRFARKHRLKAGWHWGLVIGPSWCREWLSAKPAWVPTGTRSRGSWPVCRLYFLARCGQFAPERLSKRLAIPVEDAREKAAFPKMYRNNFWRIALREWKHGYDEIGLTIREPSELAVVERVLQEALATLAR